MKADFSFGGVRLEIRCGIANRQCHDSLQMLRNAGASPSYIGAAAVAGIGPLAKRILSPFIAATSENKAGAVRRAEGNSPNRKLAAGGLALFEADGLARETGGVEISHWADTLSDQDGGKAAVPAGALHKRSTCGLTPPGSASSTTRPCSRPLNGIFRPSTCAMVLPMSALLTGASLTKPDLKLGPDRRHEIHGVGAAEAAVHALALLQSRCRPLRRCTAPAGRSRSSRSGS